jgi:hypothetical protein
MNETKQNTSKIQILCIVPHVFFWVWNFAKMQKNLKFRLWPLQRLNFGIFSEKLSIRNKILPALASFNANLAFLGCEPLMQHQKIEKKVHWLHHHEFYLEFRTHWLLHKKIGLDIHWWKLSTPCMTVGLDHRPSSFNLMTLVSISNFYFFLCFTTLFSLHYGKSSKTFQNIGLVCWGYCCKFGGPIRTNLLQNT